MYAQLCNCTTRKRKWQQSHSAHANFLFINVDDHEYFLKGYDYGFLLGATTVANAAVAVAIALRSGLFLYGDAGVECF